MCALLQEFICSDIHFSLSSYRALVLQAHHEGAHISCGLVVDDDHGFLFRDGPYVITPLRYCKAKDRRIMVKQAVRILLSVPWTFSEAKLSVFSVCHQNSSCVSLRSNNHIECIFFLKINKQHIVSSTFATWQSYSLPLLMHCYVS